MLFRALLISLLLHLAALLSLVSMLSPSQSDSPRSRNALNLSLRHVGGQGLPPISVQSGAMAVSTAHATDRVLHGVSNNKSKPFILPPFSPLTVATSVQTKSDPVGEQADFSAVSSETLSEYRLSLARVARRFKAYPPLARDEGWQGEVIVVVAIHAGMATPVVSLGRSSGHQLLDQQALEMVSHAVQNADFPESLRGKFMSISLPVEYSLAD